MLHLSWHGYLMLLSFFASIAGLALLFNDQSCETDLEVTDRVLLMMTFTYWLVYCVAIGVQNFVLPEWELVLLSVKITGVIAYLLTSTCILSLPLHRVATRQVE